jgi:8-oxo-dGTP pyrophosphatase MutT (NUDIX family)
MSDPDIIKAAGVIVRSPHGRILMCRRVDDGTWAFPGGGIKDGEDAAQCAWREFFEETGYRLGDAGKPLMQRVKDGVDFTTFVTDCEDEFVPRLNHEHSEWAWLDPRTALAEAGR